MEPLPLDSSLFLDPHFHPDAFLTARRHILPSDLRSHLQAYLSQRREDLIKIINDDYQDFITLSRQVAGVDKVVKNLDESLVGAYQELSKASEPLVNLNSQINDKLAQRAKLREYKSALRLLTSIEESTLNVESLLMITHPQSPSSSLTTTDQRKSSLQRSKNAPRKIDRIASEYNHLLYLSNKGKHMKLVQLFQPRIDRISTALQQDLNSLFSSRLLTPQQENGKLPQPQEELLLECLRTYIYLGKQPEAEKVFRDNIVRPWVVQNITSTALTKPLPFTPDENESASFKPLQFPPEQQYLQSNPLTILYNRILYFIHVDCSSILNTTNSSASTPSTSKSKSTSKSAADASATSTNKSTSSNAEDDNDNAKSIVSGGIHFVANVIWEQVSNRLVTEIGQPLFAVGDPDQFFKYYTITTKFIQQIEALCSSQSEDQLHALYTHDSFQSFNKKWQLGLYFKLRLNEIVTDLEKQFEKPLTRTSTAAATTQAKNRNSFIPNNDDSGFKFLLLYSQATHNALRRCWSNDVYINDLCSLFYKLSLQILSRYQTAIKHNLSQYISIPNSSQQSQLKAHNRTASSTRSSMDQQAAAAMIANSSSSLAKQRSFSENEGERDDAQDDSLLSHLSSVVSDLVTFEKAAWDVFDNLIAQKLPENSPPTLSKSEENNEGEEDCSPRAVWSELVGFIESLIPEMEYQIVQINVKRCSEPLRLVRSVATQVRNNPNPTLNNTREEPSYFVPGILKSLKFFLFESESGLLVQNDEIKRRWAKAVVEEILLKYTSVIIAMKKSDDSLRRLKKGRGGPGDTSSSASSTGGSAFSLFGRAFSSSSQQQAQQQSQSPSSSSSVDDEQDERVKAQMLRDVDFLVKDATDSFGIIIEGNSQPLDNLRKIITSTGTSSL